MNSKLLQSIREVCKVKSSTEIPEEVDVRTFTSDLSTAATSACSAAAQDEMQIDVEMEVEPAGMMARNMEATNVSPSSTPPSRQEKDEDDEDDGSVW